MNVAIDAAKKWLKENNTSFTYTANWAYFDDAGKTKKVMLNQACHASYNSEKTEASVIATELCVNNRAKTFSTITDKTLKPFINWLVNESIYAPCIASKDVDEICEMNGIVISLDFPTQLVMSAMIIARHPYEKNNKCFTVFNELLEQGYDPNIAFYICFNTTFSVSKEEMIFQPVSGHCALSKITLASLKRMKAKELGAFVKDYFNTPARDPNYRSIYGTVSLYEDQGNIGGYSSLILPFFSETLIREDKALQSIIRAYRGEATDAAYRPPNPFKQGGVTKREPWEITIKEAKDILFPYMKEKGLF